MKKLVSRRPYRLAEKKEGWSKRLARAIKSIRKDGLSAEQMAVDLNVSANTVYTWESGRRVPGFPTIKFIESMYGVKVL